MQTYIPFVDQEMIAENDLFKKILIVELCSPISTFFDEKINNFMRMLVSWVNISLPGLKMPYSQI